MLVIEREQQAGGIPRHAAHQGFGWRDLHRVMSGPRYARHLTERADRAGVRLALGTQVTGWSPDGALELTGRSGPGTVAADAVVLATGCRERPRSARLIPGTRPEGVLTTGTLQQLVHLEHERVGRRAVIVGAEHVSFSALATLRHGGARAVAMITELAHHQSFGGAATATALRYRVPVRTRTKLSAILGAERVTGVELTDLDSGAVERVACDLVVLTADWIPEHELAATGGARLDRGTRGPVVDQTLRTTRPRLFAAGNVLHGAEPAGIAALAGRRVAGYVIDHVAGARWPALQVPITVEPPLRWIVPNALSVRGAPPAAALVERFALRAREELLAAWAEVGQGERVLHRERLARAMPGRSVALRGDWATRVDPQGPGLTVRVVSARRRPAGPRWRRA